MAQSWVDIIAESPGEYSVYCSTPGTPVTLAHRADEVVEAASTIKVPILIALLTAAQHKQLSLRKQINLKRSDVGRNGSGLLQSMYFNTPFTLYNLAFLMMTISDNVATNVIINLLGFDKLNQFIKDDLGMTHTKLIMRKLSFEAGYSIGKSTPMAQTTAHEMAGMMERLYAGKLLDAYHTRVALRIMSRIQKSTFNRRLPDKKIKQFVSKTGWIDSGASGQQIMNECGLIRAKSGRVYVFSVFATLPTDQELTYSLDAPARHEFASLGRALFEALENL